jgi:glycosyltransferase involved in cell wall biosynthesis
LKVSIITVVRNNQYTIKDAINSVLNQTYSNIEYIVIDGFSTDGTVDIIKSYGSSIDKFISQKDDGIYDAMNKGIKMATGDIVGILNSDDFYINNSVIENIVNEFQKKDFDSVYANLVYVKSSNLNKVVRYYDSSHFSPKKFAYGWMPAHPTFFVKRDIYVKYGLFKTNYKISADYEILARFIGKYKITYSYINKTIIKMRLGGVSTNGLKNSFILNQENIRACRENGIYTNWLMIISKYPKKIIGLLYKKV